MTLGADMARPSRTGGKISEAKARNASPAKGRKTTKTKPRIAPAATRVKRRPVSGPSKDLKEAREQQAVTAEILKVIASSPNDVQPVFDAIVASANRLIGGFSAGVFRLVDGIVHLASYTPVSPTADEALRASFPRPVAELPYFDLAKDGEVSQEADTETSRDDRLKNLARARGFRSRLLAPLMSNKTQIGVIAVTRTNPGPFAAHQVELLQTFADQAVIAIENVRLFNETREALERQTATADVLKVIASSPTDLGPVFQAIADRSNRLLAGHSTAVARFVDNVVELSAFTPVNPDADGALQAAFPRPLSTYPLFELARDGEVVEIADSESELGAQAGLTMLGRARGYRSLLIVPLVGNNGTIGLISVTRKETGHFAANHVQLLRTFADQAVIAIQNVRLFEEVQARTNDLTEALQQQTATADVLKVISRSAFDLQNILDTLIESAALLCTAERATLVHQQGQTYVRAALHGFSKEAVAEMKNSAVDLKAGTIASRALRQCAVVHVADVSADPDYPETAALVLGGVRTVLSVPLVRDGRPIGAITLSRTRVDPFTPTQIDLIRTFADQAVIAIENVRLFDEVQAKTRDLSESLQQQTATADVLKVISRSAFDLGSVMNTLTHSAAELCKAEIGALYLREGDVLVARGVADADPEQVDFLRRTPLQNDSSTYVGRTIRAGAIRNIADVANETEIGLLKRFSEALGFRSILFVPLMREGRGIGVFALARKRTGQFSPREVDLVQTFADQAVIAVENVRLFDEVQAKTRDLTEALTYQTGSANILKVIASTPTDVGPVLNAIVESACELCEAYDAVLVLKQGDELWVGAHHGEVPLNRTKWPTDRSTLSGRSIADGLPVHVHDITLEGAEFPLAREMALRYGGRSVLAVPMLIDGESIGAIVLRRTEVQPFGDKQIALLQTFADQAVIAIGNVRLFEEVQAKTRDLEESLQQQTATADVLQVISSSPGDLAPVFDKMLENAIRVCGAEFGSMNLSENGGMRPAAQYNVPDEYAAARSDHVFVPHPQSPLARAISTKQVVHWADLRTTEGYLERYARTVELVELAGARTVAIVPMLRDDEVIGAITIFRNEVQLFSDKQIELLSNFAKQAVIAIENARLLKELRQRTDDLSKSLDELRTAQDRLIQTEKLASLGQLTAGIAHEIKNPLNFVNNFSALSGELIEEVNDVLSDVPLDPKKREVLDELMQTLKSNLEKVVQHGKRADSIVKNMLLHSREGSGEHRAADINSLLDESLNLAYHGARAERGEFNITLQRDFDADAGIIDAFPQEISRAFLNLISNAVYAATKRKLDGKEPGFEPILRATTKNLGSTVEIRIRDNGSGIPLEVQQKMFNPFFTTKPAGEGTGLGLSMTHDIIVKQHGGRIEVATESGQFTEFTIVLPRKSNVSGTDRGKP
ncbi:GAF domain-containing protein [Bradyrhizobium sp. OAE829]|uniref:GAF domain-containing protein n=1 Tax=Bradyrhizobium sp. OAE829 TaxID=2663807 RepID=UPI00178A7EA4